MASSSATAILAAGIAALLVLALSVPHVAAARALGVVEWPCCRQYDAPPTVAGAQEETSEVPVEPWWPPHHDQAPPPSPVRLAPAPPVHPSPDRLPYPPHGQAPPPEGHLYEAGADSETTDNAEPEWPCCRQYDAPPTV